QQVSVQVSTLEEILADALADTVNIETLNRLAAVEGIQTNAALNFQINRILELQEERRSLTAGALGLRPDNPQVEGIDQRIRESQESLRSAIAAALQSLHRQEASLAERVTELRGDLLSFPGKQTRIAQLQLEASILEETNRYLLGQYQQAQMQEATIAPYVTILDGASPPSPIGTNLRQKIILGLLVGLLLGLGGAFFLEYLDQTIKDASDVERAVGTPVLGRIPLESRLAGASGGNGRRQGIVVLTDLSPDDPAVEAYRALRTNVTYVGAEQPIQFIVVTSPGPAEGKSTTAVNLAVTLAQSHSRTLLIDGDLRRPQLHRAFQLVEFPGLTDLLVAQAEQREAVRPEVLENLDVLPAGSQPPNPAELLGSDTMRDIVTRLRRDYDYIVMDTPPSLPVTDAAIVAAMADATILVMRSGETEEDAAQRTVEQLRRVRARVAGTVLNGVSAKNDRYYAYYSSKGYPTRRSRHRKKSLRSRIAASL
ncbi:MAG: polysaccharide biosynthesis tyrosine autokinase, partial [Gemmatimonadales bacterium]